MFAPVATGVEKLDGISEVKMVVLESEIRYLLLSLATRASLKPAWKDQYSNLDDPQYDKPLTLLPLPTMMRLSHNSCRL